MAAQEGCRVGQRMSLRGAIHSIDPILTIKAPYDQGDIMYFGEDARKQCVAISLSTLIYNKIREYTAIMPWYKLWRS